MATVPIEVILQDAESPVTPTPESGEETNITVPDTGTISDGGSNSGGIGSSASIILPAIIAVLAIGAIVAMLVHKYHKHQNDKLSKKEKVATAASGTIAILAATVLVGNLVIPATNAATSVEPGTAELDVVDKITITATREADSNTVTATAQNISYATANLDFGYKVTASMAKGTTTANLYLDGNTESPYYIAPTENVDLSTNSWGYMLEGGEYYQPMSLANTPATIAKGSDNIIENKPVDVYYTINADKTLPAGTYTGEIEYTLTDNNFPSTLTTMQGMTTEICENTYTPGKQVTDPVPTATLEDIRDHKTYTIAKLADGNCWMTQNLDFDIVKGGVEIDSTNTDVPEDWADAGHLANTHTTNDIAWSGSSTAPESYDPGALYWNGVTWPKDQTTCEEYGGTWRDPGYRPSYCEGANLAVSAGDSHYHLGNYYNWTAAVAMSDSSSYIVDQQDANQSICPAGWTLPKSGEQTGSRSFVYLMEQYSSNIARGEPLYLFFGGSWAGTLEAVGDLGKYWSSIVNSISGTVYNLYFNYSSDIFNPWSFTGRDGGNLVRCVAK